jgi:hypothetical protein
MRVNFDDVMLSISEYGISHLNPLRSTANPFECPGLLGLNEHYLILRLYYELVRLPYRHTSALPLQLVGGFF